MFTIEKLLQLEKPIIDADPYRIYYRDGNVPTTQELIRNYQNFIKKQDIIPNNHLEQVIPILLYKSHYRSDFYSRIVNLPLSFPEPMYQEMRSFFGDWLELALSFLPSFCGEVSHSIKPCDLQSPEILAADFNKHIGEIIRVRKFISTSELDRECNLRLDITCLGEGSSGKQVWDLLYEESKLGEREVLFNRNTDFLIVAVVKVNDIWRIKLEETISENVPPPLEFQTNYIKVSDNNI
jgi:hypothetical protein